MMEIYPSGDQSVTFTWPNQNLPWHHGRYQFTPPRPDLAPPGRLSQWWITGPLTPSVMDAIPKPPKRGGHGCRCCDAPICTDCCGGWMCGDCLPQERIHGHR